MPVDEQVTQEPTGVDFGTGLGWPETFPERVSRETSVSAGTQVGTAAGLGWPQ